MVFFAGGKQDILLPTGPTSHGVPGVGSMASMPFGHGDATYIQRQQARER